MSFLKRLFGGAASSETAAGKPVKQIEHKGFTIAATPYMAEGQYQTCGLISKEIGGEMKEHKFIRADRFSSVDDAADMTLRKGTQIVDEQGDKLFN